MFDSRNPVYKNPVGATPAGQSIHFKITLPRGLKCTAATLNLQNERGRPGMVGMRFHPAAQRIVFLLFFLADEPGHARLEPRVRRPGGAFRGEQMAAYRIRAGV